MVKNFAQSDIIHVNKPALLEKFLFGIEVSNPVTKFLACYNSKGSIQDPAT